MNQEKKAAAEVAGGIDIVAAGKDTEKVLVQAKQIILAYDELADILHPRIHDVRDGAKGKAKAAKDGFVGMVVAAKDKALSPIKDAKSAQEMRKLVKESRQKLLSNAGYIKPATDFLKLMSEADKTRDAVGIGLVDAPGCFVLATYPKHDKDDDYTNYQDVFVGSGVNVGEEIARCCSRAGNPDVYADIKFGQNVWLFIFSCGADVLEEKRQAMVSVLQAEESYNAAIQERFDSA